MVIWCGKCGGKFTSAKDFAGHGCGTPKAPVKKGKGS